MGLFNYVDFKENCPVCKIPLEFQTKDDTYDELYLNKVDFRSVHRFYGYCSQCKIEVEYNLKEDWTKRKLEDYERSEIDVTKE